MSGRHSLDDADVDGFHDIDLELERWAAEDVGPMPLEECPDEIAMWEDQLEHLENVYKFAALLVGLVEHCLENLYISLKHCLHELGKKLPRQLTDAASENKKYKKSVPKTGYVFCTRF